MVQELLQHSILDREQLLESEAVALCQPLVSRVVPACLQSRSTLAEGSATMVLSQMLGFCAQHAGTATRGLPEVMHILLIAVLAVDHSEYCAACMQSTQ